MENTLGVGLLDKRDCLDQGLLGTFKIFLINGHTHSFNGGLHHGFDVEVSDPPFFILPGSFYCR